MPPIEGWTQGSNSSSTKIVFLICIAELLSEPRDNIDIAYNRLCLGTIGFESQ
jgi:hypothetical protein